MINAVIFDLDDTLCNSSEAILLSLEESFKRYIAHFPNMSAKQLMEINKIAFEEVYSKNDIPSSSKSLLTWIRIYELIKIKPSIEHFLEITMFQKNEVLKNLHLYKGVNELLQHLFKRNVRMGIITNGPFEDQSKKMIHLGISHYFEYITSPDIALASKPDSAIYKYALKKMIIEPHEGIMVGNSLIEDLKGAKSLGMKTVLVGQRQNNNNIENHFVDLFIPTISDLLTHLIEFK